MGSTRGMNLLLLFHTILGTGLVASGASALNQYFERDLDARMVRTRNRPLPDGRLLPHEALIFFYHFGDGAVPHYSSIH
jgi:protoheme IX farnesyltransferase